MLSPELSVVTLVRGRRGQLRNMLRGLRQSDLLPAEVIVAAMDELQPEELAPLDLPFPVNVVRVRPSGASVLPLAAARNAAVARARHDDIVMLDVDCIPAPDALELLHGAVQQHGGVVMGDVRYLPRDAVQDDFEVAALDQLAVRHPRRPHLNDGELLPAPAYHLLWTLCLAFDRATYQGVGGLDEQYDGYGAEDTDFAFALREAGEPFHLLGARVYHQYHPVYRPPIGLLRDIAGNARVFRRKWGVWPMEGWLAAFEELGLIRWDRTGTRLEVLRDPTQSELDAAFRDDGRGF